MATIDTPTKSAPLPDLLTFNDGTPVQFPGDWPRRRAELAAAIVPLQYGELPPPGRVTAELLHAHTLKRYFGAKHATYRLTVTTDNGSAIAFVLDLMIPPGDGPFPVIVDGDGCWRYVTDEITLDVLRRRNILATFNRCEVATDNRLPDRKSGVYTLYPQLNFGAISAWAWAYHRCIDFLTTMTEVDAGKIVVTGHSRGGKTALLAGATDERVAITNPNNSGCSGAGSYFLQAPGSETLADIVKVFPYWFPQELSAYIGRETELPFDQHFLKAMVAPRLLLSTEALGDAWANPVGTFHTHAAARAVFERLGVSDQVAVIYREGVHQHAPSDWVTLLDFMDWHFHQKRDGTQFDLASINRAPVMPVRTAL